MPKFMDFMGSLGSALSRFPAADRAEREQILRELESRSRIDIAKQGLEIKQTAQRLAQQRFEEVEKPGGEARVGYLEETTRGLAGEESRRAVEFESSRQLREEIAGALGMKPEILAAMLDAGKAREVLALLGERKKLAAPRAEAVAGFEEARTKAEAARAERQLLPVRTEAEIEATRAERELLPVRTEAEKTEAALATRRAKALMAEEVPEEEARITMELLGLKPEQVRVENILKRAQAKRYASEVEKEADLREMFAAEGLDYGQWKVKSEQVKAGMPLITNIRQAIEQIAAIETATGDKLTMLIGALRGTPAGGLMPAKVDKDEALRILKAYVDSSKNLLKTMGIDWDDLEKPDVADSRYRQTFNFLKRVNRTALEPEDIANLRREGWPERQIRQLDNDLAK